MEHPDKLIDSFTGTLELKAEGSGDGYVRCSRVHGPIGCRDPTGRAGGRCSLAKRRSLLSGHDTSVTFLPCFPGFGEGHEMRSSVLLPGRNGGALAISSGGTDSIDT